MTDASKAKAYFQSEEAARLVRRRYAAEKRFRFYGMAMIAVAIFFLGLLFYTIISGGVQGFQSTSIKVPVPLTADALGVEQGATPEQLRDISGFKLTRIARAALHTQLGIAD